MTHFHPPARNSSRLGQRFQVAIGAAAALAAIGLSPGSAHAYVVTVNSVQYDVTTFTGTYNANISKFALPTNGGVMPWYGSQSLALQFADAVGNTFGNPLYYAYGYVSDPGSGFDPIRVQTILWTGSSSTGTGIDPGLSYQYAQVAPAAAVPGPLPVFGAAAAFGFSRKLRRRIKLAQGALGSSQPRA